MDILQILDNLYSAFSEYKRPQNFTKYWHCMECSDHNDTMLSATLETLNSTHLGSGGWCPFNFLTASGFAHYMPRLVELAITGAVDTHGELFLFRFLLHLTPSAECDRFTSYSGRQCNAILLALLYAQHMFKKELVGECYCDDMADALVYWINRSHPVNEVVYLL